MSFVKATTDGVVRRIVVHPTFGYEEKTVAHALMHYMNIKSEKFKIRFINRLDMDTTGLLAVAKNQFIQNAIVGEMKRGNVEKRYIAAVSGKPEDAEGVINAPSNRGLHSRTFRISFLTFPGSLKQTQGLWASSGKNRTNCQ